MTLNIVEKTDENVKIRNVLISLSDKTGLERLVTSLLEINRDVKFYSTGGTYGAVKDLIGTDNLIAVSDYTGQPEMQGGLVKTLDFRIYMGLLSETYNKSHQDDLKRIGAVEFDLVAVNLYPFSETVKKDGATLESGRTNIDIGGPTMLRASAKNFLRVLSLCDPGDYSKIIDELKMNEGCISLETRMVMAAKTFTHTAEYDRNIAGFLAEKNRTDIDLCYNRGE